MPNIEELTKDYPLSIEIPVAWGEMDAFQHVNNIVYFRYFESARIAYFERINYIQFTEEQGLGPILASTHCTFKYPLTYPDRVTVATKVSEIQEDRFTMDYLVLSQASGKVAAQGQGLVVSYDYRNRKKALLPIEIRQRILDLEATTEKHE
ncbi:MAG: acyl-CoA thioesterase [bacterium]